MTEHILTVQQVAEYLAVDAKSIYRLVGRGELPGFKVGGAWRFQKADIDTWILEQKTVLKSKGKATRKGKKTK